MIYFNGWLVPEEEAKVSIFDRGFLYGDGLFETMRAYRGKVFKLREHLERLFNSARIISLPISKMLKELEEAVYETLRANNLKDAYLRLTISRGEGERGLDLPLSPCPNIIMVAKPLPPYPKRWYEEGLKAIVVKVRREKDSVLSQIKSLNYLPNILAKLEAKEKGADEGIMLNEDGYLTEATVSNIFLISQGKLLTPSLKSGVLPGITRKTVMELAPPLGLEVSEREVNLSQLMEAEEAFLTNSLREVVPLTQVNGHPIGRGRPGKLTTAIAQAYSRAVENDSYLFTEKA